MERCGACRTRSKRKEPHLRRVVVQHQIPRSETVHFQWLMPPVLYARTITLYKMVFDSAFGDERRDNVAQTWLLRCGRDQSIWISETLLCYINIWFRNCWQRWVLGTSVSLDNELEKSDVIILIIAWSFRLHNRSLMLNGQLRLFMQLFFYLDWHWVQYKATDTGVAAITFDAWVMIIVVLLWLQQLWSRHLCNQPETSNLIEQ